MQTIYDFKESRKYIRNKIDFLLKNIELNSFFLLIKPKSNIYTNTKDRELVEKQIEKLIKLGFKNIEISWDDNKNWLNYVSNLKLKFPQLNLGSASVTNKKSIDDAIKTGLNFSMMKFWNKNLFNHAMAKNHLLIPGIKRIKDLQEAIDENCKIIKIYPVKEKNELINISQYKNVNFIAAGGLSISDISIYKSLGYKAIVIGDKGFKNNDIAPEIYEWLKVTLNKNEFNS